MASLNAVCTVMQQMQDPVVEALKAELAKKQLEIERARMEAEDRAGQMAKMDEGINNYIDNVFGALEDARQQLLADRDHPYNSIYTADIALNRVLDMLEGDEDVEGAS